MVYYVYCVLLIVLYKKSARRYDSVAQLVEHRIPDPKAIGSSPVRVIHDTFYSPEWKSLKLLQFS